MLPSSSFRQHLGLFENELAGPLGLDITVVESVAVGRAVSGRLAQFGIFDQGVDGVHGHHRAVVASILQLIAGRVNCSDDSADDGRAASLHHLVADSDGVDGTPVVFGGVDDVLDFARDLLDVFDADEQLHSLGLGGGENGGNLVAACFVDPHNAEAIDLLKVAADLAWRLAGAVGIVRSICDAHWGRRIRAVGRCV